MVVAHLSTFVAHTEENNPIVKKTVGQQIHQKAFWAFSLHM